MSRRTLLAASFAAGALVLYTAVYPPFLTPDRPREPLAFGVVIGAIGAVYFGVGLYARRRRPASPLGLLFIGVGAGWLAYQLSWLPGPASYIQYAGAALELPFLAWLALAYPTGRLGSRFEVVVVAVAFAVWLYGQVWNTLTSLVAPFTRWGRSQQALVFAPARYGALALGILVLGLVVVHWWRATVRARRSVAPLVWMAGPPVAWVFLGQLQLIGVFQPPLWLWPWFNLLLISVPLGYLYGRVRDRVARGRVGALIVGLGTGDRNQDLRQALAQTLHDPSLEVGYWLPEEKRFADLGGRAVELPAPGDDRRAATVLQRDGEPLAAIVHDAAVADDPELMSAAAAAVRMAIENEQLQALVRAQLDEVRASRARIVAAHDEERRRLERDLHDGAQQRLVTLSLILGEARGRLDGADTAMGVALESAAEQVTGALAELRELAHGIHPAVLTRAGLVPALRSLAERAALPVTIDSPDLGRLPDQVEAAAYFVVAEALVNAAKHTHASAAKVRLGLAEHRLRVEVSDDGEGGADAAGGAGLRGLADRVRALDGRFTVVSPPGQGTCVVAELPCA